MQLAAEGQSNNIYALHQCMSAEAAGKEMWGHPRAGELGNDLIQAGARAAAARGIQRAVHLRARARAASGTACVRKAVDHLLTGAKCLLN